MVFSIPLDPSRPVFSIKRLLSPSDSVASAGIDSGPPEKQPDPAVAHPLVRCDPPQAPAFAKQPRPLRETAADF